MSGIFTTENMIALVTLTAMEIVLGIDNIVFISILTGKLPAGEQRRARRLGLAFAMLSRIALLLSLSFVMKLTAPLTEIMSHPVSGRDLILLVGGLFLIGKATFEVHDKLEGEGVDHGTRKAARSVGSVIAQIAVIDIVFSLDSVITAVGMASHVGVMITAVVASVCVMLVFAEVVSRFIERHPTIKILALSFMILIGVMLVAEGAGHHIEKGYIYFAMAFSLGVEMLNLRLRKGSAPVVLHQPHLPDVR